MRLFIFIGIIFCGCLIFPFGFLKVLWGIAFTFILIELFFLCFYTISALLVFKKKVSLCNPNFFQPEISVIIPARNEEKIIASTINSILRSNYPQEKLKIVVVNDLSTDRTGEICEEFERKGIVRLINRSPSAERGKAASLNEALITIEDEFICLLDADNEVSPNFFNRLVHYFQDPKVGVVQGRVKSKNPNTNFLTKLTDVEFTALYLTFLLPKGYLELTFGYMGTGELIRTSVAKELDGFDNNLATEDLEFTYHVIQHGYKIIYDPSGCTYCELLDTFRSYWHQRYRWMLGTIQAFIANFPGFYFNRKITLRKKIDFTQGFTIIASLISLIILIGISLIGIVISALNISYLTLIVFIIYTIVVFFWTGTAMFLDNRLRKGVIYVLLMPLYFFPVSIATFKGVIDEYVLRKRYVPRKATHQGLKENVE